MGIEGSGTGNGGIILFEFPNTVFVCVCSSPEIRLPIAAVINRLCLIELFRYDKEGIERTYHVEVSTRNVLSRSLGLSDGVWAVVLEKERGLSPVCRGGNLQ